MKRDYNRLDKAKFSEMIKERTNDWNLPEEWTLIDIENAANKGNQIITEVLDILIPYQRVKLTPSINKWWNKNLEKKRSMLRQIHHR